MMNGYTFTKNTIVSFFLFLFVTSTFSVFSQAPKWELIKPKYPTADAFVAGFNVMDYGADPTGKTDQTKLFQDLLDRLGSRTNNTGRGNGGVLFVPEGKYLFSGNTGRLVVPKGVTIRGEWEKPVKGKPVKGTILMVQYGRGYDAGSNTVNESRSFITLQPCASVKDLNIWYPEQDPNNIVPYPPAVMFGQNGYWGNDYCTAVNITLVNAYDGIIFSRRNGGGAPNFYGIYGTPLSRGIEIDNIAEVGRIDNVDFSPDYWSGSGLEGSPSVDGAHKKWIYDNGTGVVMRRNDWSYACKVRVDGYNKGYHEAPSIPSAGATPNGHNYAMELSNCKYAVFVESVDNVGQMHTGYKISNCEYGFYLEKDPKGVLQILGCEISATKASVLSLSGSTTKILMNQCTINKGRLELWGGITSIMNCNFNNEGTQIVLGSNIRAIVTGNRFKEDIKIQNSSMYKCIIDHTPITMTKLPDFPYKNQFEFTQKPSGTAYYLATDNGVSKTADDNTEALQILLNKAKADGGGVVFLPPGSYNFKGYITIPTGVELQGSVDVGCQPMGPGSVMEIYAGKDDENGTPFINMEKGSGVRGLVMNYPEQSVKLLPNIHKYSYTIRGNADTYIVNIGFRAVYQGVDLFTNKCDNHFIDYPSGHVFKVGIRVGGGTENGHIYNTQFNPITYGNGGETKFGVWANSPVDNENVNPNKKQEHDAAYAYCWDNLDFLILGDCKNQILYNDFHYDSNRGILLTSENGKAPSGLAMGHAIDAAIKSFNINAVGEGGFDFINSQVVTVNGGNSAHNAATRYIETGPDLKGKVTLFGSDYWGQAYEIANNIQGGTIELQSANYAAPGQRSFATIMPNAAFNIIGSNINAVNTLLNSGSESQAFIQSSIVNSNNVNTNSCGLWLNNMDQQAGICLECEAFLDRTGWEASASIYNEDAYLSIDGDTDTRWSTLSDRQKPGQWFMVNMKQEQEFTGIYLEAGGTNYYPVNFTVYVSSDGENWTAVASGRNAIQATFEPQKAQYIKVEQTGTSASASWRIVEFFVMNTGTPPTGITNVINDKNDVKVWFTDGQLNIEGVDGSSHINVYTISGQLILTSANATSSSINLNSGVSKGIYIVVINNNGNLYRKKVVKN